MTENRVRIPQIDIQKAVQIFYSKTCLNNSDIKQIFLKNPSSATISRLKDLARRKMAEKDIHAWNGNDVNTTAAYEAWHIDVSDLEKRLEKLDKLGLNPA